MHWILRTVLLAALLSAPLTGVAAPQTPSLVDLQLELAASDRFYLELDPSQSELRLMFAGVALKKYPVLSVAGATPTLCFVPLDGPRPFGSIVWADGKVEPPPPELRLEIQPPAADSAAAPPPLPPAFDATPVPWTYRLRFDRGFVVSVSSPRAAQSDAAAAVGALWDKLVAVRDAIVSRRTRLHVELGRDDAQHLFRSLPPDTQLLVLAP